MRNTFATFAAFAVISLSLARSANAAESYDNCSGFIDSVPATITTQGVWCLRADLSTSIAAGDAITIATNNVTLDCNDFKLGGLAAGIGTSAVGIRANNRLNSVIRRCNIRGFFTGVYLLGGAGHTIADSRFDGNTWIAIRTDSSNTLIRGNQVNDSGGSPAQSIYYGIVLEGGDGSEIIDNSISGVSSNQANYSATGILLGFAPGTLLRGNRVRGVGAAGTGTAYGIRSSTSFGGFYEGNVVHGDGVANSFGITCGGTAGSAVRNTVRGFTTGIAGCTLLDNLVNPN